MSIGNDDFESRPVRNSFPGHLSPGCWRYRCWTRRTRTGYSDSGCSSNWYHPDCHISPGCGYRTDFDLVDSNFDFHFYSKVAYACFECEALIQSQLMCPEEEVFYSHFIGLVFAKNCHELEGENLSLLFETESMI